MARFDISPKITTLVIVVELPSCRQGEVMTNSIPANSTDLKKVAGFTRGHAVVVAVANYQNVTPLPNAVLNDARDVVSLLTSPSHCGYDPQNVTMLVDDEVTLAALRSALDDVSVRAKTEDTVVIYFSGHGARLGDPADPQSALIPVDCQLDRLDSTALSEASFSAALAKIPAQRIVVLIDACHSGGAGSLKAAPPDSASVLGFSEKSLDRLARGIGRVLIASSRATETSLVFDGARNSLFTQHLLEVLRGNATTSGDGLIRVFEVFNHVAEKVRKAAPGRQHPIFKATNLEDNFPIALDRGGATKSTASTTPNADVRRRLEDILADLYPMGPQDQEIWARAGGDLSRLRLASTGRANWFMALRTLSQGGGGAEIQQENLIRVALDDFPHHPDLSRLSSDE
jgi:metacaspase-1